MDGGLLNKKTTIHGGLLMKTITVGSFPMQVGTPHRIKTLDQLMEDWFCQCKGARGGGSPLALAGGVWGGRRPPQLGAHSMGGTSPHSYL